MAAQSQVQISGTVQDSRTKAPLSGAKVKLLSLNINTVSDADGKFTLSGTSLLNERAGRSGRAPVVGSNSLLFSHEIDGAADVRIFDCSGKLQTVLFSGVLTKGYWHITPPRLAPGMYLCTFDSPIAHDAVRFLVTSQHTGTSSGTMRNITAASQAAPAGASKQKAAIAAPVDSIVVEKSGYRASRIPVATYVESALTILLEDTTTTVASDDATIIPDPSWTCFMPGGIPPPKLGEAAFTITLQYSAIRNVGLTKFGTRRQFDISGGSVSGSKITATVLTGGLDYELILSNGSTELEQINILRAGSTPILMRNAGVAPAGAKTVRVVLDFEAPNSSSYTWLNTGKFAANRIVDSVAKTIKLEVFDISKVTLPATRVTIKDPAGVEHQTWECLKQSGSAGTTVFTENCLLGSSINIGATKGGSRNIIPITGGTTTGKVAGKILAGGADFQLGGIDARYTLAPNDGEFIIVRNCGSGTLYPVFEARVAGPYAYLNENKYISSAPGPGSGGVSITFSEKK